MVRILISFAIGKLLIFRLLCVSNVWVRVDFDVDGTDGQKGIKAMPENIEPVFFPGIFFQFLIILLFLQNLRLLTYSLWTESEYSFSL